MKDGVKERWIEEEGWIKERIDGSSIHCLICLVKHGKVDENDSFLYLI